MSLSKFRSTTAPSAASWIALAATLLTACSNEDMGPEPLIESEPNPSQTAGAPPAPAPPPGDTMMPMAGSPAPVMTAPQAPGQGTPPPASMNNPGMAPQAMGPQPTGPDMMDPGVADPEVTDPEVTDPEVTDPEVTDPEVTDPEVTDPEVTDPEVTDPEVTGPDWMTREDLGEGDGSDVVTLGDSWMEYFGTSGGISGALRRAGKRYTNHAVPGVRLLSGAGAIPGQWTTATRRNPDIKTVIMTGGGNDVLLSPGAQTDCRLGGETCKMTLARIGETLGKMWSDMAEAGVQDVVYVGYSTDAGSAGPAAADLSMNGVQEICDAAPLNCHTLQATDIVMGQFADGIHPTSRANDRLAAAILELMAERGVRR